VSNKGFYKRRRGILEHLEAGVISLLDLAVHDVLCLRANAVVGNGSSFPPGVVFASAKAIHAMCPSQISERAIQRSLEHLEELAWIKRWHVRGRHGNYPILIARYSVADLSGNEYRVNVTATTNWKDPTLEPVGEPSLVEEFPGESLSPNKEIRTKRRNQNTSPSSEAAASRQYVKPAAERKQPSDTAGRLARHLIDRMLVNNPRARITESQEEQWAWEADRMMRIDGRTEQEIAHLIEWSQRDTFWRANILSMKKLREKFDQLALKSEPNSRDAHKNVSSSEGGTQHGDKFSNVPRVQ
jgi:serine/threonine protein kinase